ncbi:tyrosine-type recombinase/integrase [Rhodococcus jostii]|uniref:tyrosine-type recombinase/integrase n=1 Tax=Rhodococcus jostii TaxID=132919 RepID=UPI00363928EE
MLLELGNGVTWHSLRHFYASTLIYSGASVKAVQERLGHSSAETSLKIYAHMWPSGLRSRLGGSVRRGRRRW